MKEVRTVSEFRVDSASHFEQLLVKLPGVLFASVLPDREDQFQYKVVIGADKASRLSDKVFYGYMMYGGSLLGPKAQFTLEVVRGIKSKKSSESRILSKGGQATVPSLPKLDDCEIGL